ncbi:flagellar filament capping protein FliD [Helicobacter ailurogastricus]|uniref:Flagellar hook-associated protein 2 n=1 Tax=Helicobacter ailurogastricus TaxID=1578720 RepID=A0A0K2Y0Z4_9HELI|nr:flagellar filament capping protein FliD [Helicobacter ailurogastricus]CRF41023.1 Flagellar hook-associated protein FliD [Helicobacter ailurogastricus]CRF42311.1 Flagellar hook-associated protein FliD [Helicobacter ailurogastricus]CRF44791.1 Flagellar hook-associated protein FliD [Helicobacter ailurogastricus]CRF52002.1 Flagellar hook-associated protein FliD [Helicobacter ailurogastricus]BDQ29116.1 flagellar hook-associated protein 2 [Helicobacter ailurogastricus]
MGIGKLSSLGIGSKVLNYDVIDKLKKADEQMMVVPIEKKMEANVEKQKALIEIKTLISNLKSPVDALTDYSTYTSRNSSVSGDALKATVSPGIPVQNIKVEVENLAQGDINEVTTHFRDRDDAFSEADTKLHFYTNNKNYTINIKAGMSLGDVAQAITDATDGNVLGIVMKTGGDKPYQLMLNSKNPGANSRIYFGTSVISHLSSDAPITLATGGTDQATGKTTEDDFFIKVKDAQGQVVKIPIALNIGTKTAVQNKNQALQEAIKKALEANPQTKSLLESGQLNVGLVDDGKSLILNDKRGFSVEVGGAKAAELGFIKTTSNTEDLVKGTTGIPSGQMTGVVNFNGHALDLSKITLLASSSDDNGKAIVKAINAISGLHASLGADGKLVINSDSGELRITGVGPAGKAAVSKLGLTEGLSQSYAKIHDLFGFKNLQKASDAKFTYNGATITRPTNEVNDVINGVSLTLLSKTEPGKPAIVSITRDSKAIVDNIKAFVKAYNELIPKLDETTRYDPDTHIAGVFNGVSDIRTIRSSINNAIAFSITSAKGVDSLMKYGISLDEHGKMSLDEARLTNAINTDPQAAQDFFYGSDVKSMGGKEIHQDGIFIRLDKVLAGLVDGGNARLKLYENSLEQDAKDLRKDKESAMEMLKTRYDTMAERFAAYDERISKANKSFDAVQMMIDQAAAKKN